MLAIFDNDGTICDSQEAETICYIKAMEKILGKALPTNNWTDYEEPTSTGIIREILADDPEINDKEEAIEKAFLELLEEAKPKYPNEFKPIAGAVEFIQRLSEKEDVTVAIATGCFESTAAFKLDCCGVEMKSFPFATSSDTPCRRDIIPLAAQRADADLSSAIFFGDGQWDVKVSRELGIPMIGIGRGIDKLEKQGIEYVFRDYTDQDLILDTMDRLVPKRQV